MKHLLRKVRSLYTFDFFLLNILHAFNDGYRISIVLFLPFIAKDLNLDLTTVGFLGSVFSTLGIIFAIPAGQIALKIGGMRTLIFAMFLYAIGFLLTGFASNTSILILTFIIAGFGFSIFHPIGFALVAKWASKENRGQQIGTFSAWGEIGKIGIASAVTFVIGYLGWRYASAVYAIPALLIACCVLWYFSKHIHPDAVKEKQSPHIRFREILKHHAFVITLIAGFFDVIASSALLLFLPFLLLEQGISATIIGLYAAAYFVGNLIGKTYIGKFVDRWGSKTLFIFSEVAMAIGIVLLLSTNDPIVLFISTLFVGAFSLGTVPAIQAMVSESSEHHGNFEKSFAVSSLVASIAAAMAPFSLGVISDAFSIQMAFFMMAFFAILAAIPASILVFQLRDKK